MRRRRVGGRRRRRGPSHVLLPPRAAPHERGRQPQQDRQAQPPPPRRAGDLAGASAGDAAAVGRLARTIARRCRCCPRRPSGECPRCRACVPAGRACRAGRPRRCRRGHRMPAAPPAPAVPVGATVPEHDSMPGPGGANAVPSMHVGPVPLPPLAYSTVMLAPALLTELTVIVSPPAGSVNGAPTGSAASLKLLVEGVMSSKNVCSPRSVRPRRSAAMCTSTRGVSAPNRPACRRSRPACAPPGSSSRGSRSSRCRRPPRDA